MSEKNSTVERRLNELENPAPENNFHHYVRPLANRIIELENREEGFDKFNVYDRIHKLEKRMKQIEVLTHALEQEFKKSRQEEVEK